MSYLPQNKKGTINYILHKVNEVDFQTITFFFCIVILKTFYKNYHSQEKQMYKIQIKCNVDFN